MLQVSESGLAQSKKLMELADTTRELKRTKEALERAERIVFEQRQQGEVITMMTPFSGSRCRPLSDEN